MAAPEPALPAGGRSGHGRVPTAPDPLPIPVVDNHTHLDIAREGEALVDVAEVVAAATAVGVDRLVQIGCDLPGARFTAEVVDKHDAILGGVALHPNEAPRLAAAGDLDAAYREIEELASHPRIRTVGETGLDYFRTGPEGIGVQQDSFRWHIDLAKRLGKTLQIHDRDSHEDVLRILEEEGAPENVVMHCFSGDIAMARTCVQRGYLLSFSGTVTFKNAGSLRNALSITPLEQVLVETDAPYLAPAPWRGATNAPFLVPLTVRVMADVMGVSVPSLCEALSENSERVYGPW
jgi:TatD DNase family protein